MHRLARIFSLALITAGVVILADAGITLAWKEPISSAYSQIQQREAGNELDSLSQGFLEETPAATATEPGPRQQIRRLAKRFEGRVDKLEGKPIGRIDAPDAGIDWIVVEGTDQKSLHSGPGHYPATALPGLGRTVGIAGHRTTYGAPFHDINKFSEGDRIELKMPYGTLIYRVSSTRIVEPTDTQIVRDTGAERLVLTACHPLYSAAQRYAVFADLERVKPADRA